MDGSGSSGGAAGGGSGGDAWLEAGTPVDLSWLHFALHKRAAREGQYDLAWAALEAGNRLMATSGDYDPSRERAAAKQVMEVFQGPFPTPGSSSGSPGGGGGSRGSGSAGGSAEDGSGGGGGWEAESRGAIFVVGFPRSGSTLLEQMLGSHSKVRVLGGF